MNDNNKADLNAYLCKQKNSPCKHSSSCFMPGNKHCHQIVPKLLILHIWMWKWIQENTFWSFNICLTNNFQYPSQEVSLYCNITLKFSLTCTIPASLTTYLHWIPRLTFHFLLLSYEYTVRLLGFIKIIVPVRIIEVIRIKM